MTTLSLVLSLCLLVSRILMISQLQFSFRIIIMLNLQIFLVPSFYFLLSQANDEIVFSTGGFPKGFLEDIVESSVVQDRLQSRWKWEVWDVVPGTHTFNIYVFNITNPAEMENGGKPKFQELGPYAYVEHRTKFNVSVNMDLSVNYRRNFTYNFVPSESKGTKEDLVTVLNVPFIIFSKFASKKGTAGNRAVNALVSKGEGFLKRNIRVGDLLFEGMDVGIYIPYLPVLQLPPSPTLDEFVSGRYGIMKLKAGANEGAFTVDSGLNEKSNMGKIKTWNGYTELPYWYGPRCNDINGTDGTVLSRYVSNTEPIYFFDVDLCRSINFVYNESSAFEFIVPTYIFNMDPNLLNDSRNYPSNLCFCKDAQPNGENCLKNGLLDVSACRDGTPYVMSLPHFYLADQSYADAVDGMNPTEERHQTQMMVQPRLGVVVEYFRRFQWNLQIEKYVTLDYFRNAKFKSIVFPILWNDDHLKLDEDKAELMVSEIANEMGGYGSGGMRMETSGAIFTLLAVFPTFFL